MSENLSSPSQQEDTKLAPVAGFKFLTSYGGIMGLRYKKAKIYRGEKKWYVYYSYFHDGKFHRFRVYENINREPIEEREAYAKLLKDAVNYHLINGFDPFEEELKVVVKNWTVVQGLNYFKQNLGNRGLRKRTEQTYGSVLKFLYKYLPLQTPIKELSKITVNAVFRKAYQDKGWSNVTFNNYITLTRAIWNYLIEEEVTDNNPIKVKPLQETITRHKYFSHEIFNKIKEEATDEVLEFMMFVYHTATRPRRETAYMRYEYILKERGLLLIPAAINKVKKDGFIPLSDYIKNRYTKKEGRIFPHTGGYYSDIFTELKKRLKIDPNHTIYSMKHTRCIHMVEDGATLDEIMRFCRHSNPRTTQKYLRELGAEINFGIAEKGIKF